MAQDQKGYEGAIAAVQCGSGGLAQNLNPSKIRLRNVILAEGAVFREDHWRKEPGTDLFGVNTVPVGDPSDAVVVSLVDWHPTEAIQRVVHLRGDGYLYLTNNGGTDPGANQSALTSGPGTRFGYFVTGGSEDQTQNRKLFLFRANKSPTYLNGDVTTDVVLPLPALDWSDAHPPIVGIVNGARLWAAGNSNAPHMLYASKFGDMTDFQTTLGFDTDFQALPIFPGIGERIYALRNYQGFIAIFKYPRGIFLQDARDTDPLNWGTQQVTDAVGIAASPYAALQLENDVLFMGSDGLFYLLSTVISAAQGHTNMAIANVAMDLDIYQFLLQAYNRGRLNQVQSVYQPFWQTAQFSITGPGSSTNNTRFIFDTASTGREGGTPRFSYSYRDKVSALALWRDPEDFIDKPIFGTYQSQIITMEQDARTAWDGAAYPFRVQTPHTNLGEFESLTTDKFVQFANRNKLFDNLEIEYVPFTDATVMVTVFVDGIVKQTLTVPLQFGGDVIGAFVLGESALAGGSVRSVVRALKAGGGKRISLLFECNNAAEDAAITHFFLGFRVGDTTQVPR